MQVKTRIPFTKMQGLGNDFILLEERNLSQSLTSKQIRWLSDRREGVGCDQLILLRESKNADAEISFYNADGSEAGACGNGTRCVAKYLGKEQGTIQTPTFLSHFSNKRKDIEVTLKNPTIGIPIDLSVFRAKAYPIELGNHHIVIFTDDLNMFPLEEEALSLQRDQGANVEVARVESPSRVEVRVWERGVGITPSCGSGACAVGVMGLKLGLLDLSPVIVDMDGGFLEIDWAEGEPLKLIGPAEICFEGTIDLP